jgi:hypothetical protein
MKSKYLLPAILLFLGIGVGFGGGYYYKGIVQQRQFGEMRNGTGPRPGMPSRMVNGGQGGVGELAFNYLPDS